MLNRLALKSEIVKNGLTQEKLAIKLGMNPKTFYRKMSKGIFGSDEISKMIDILNITDPMSIFFATKVTCEDTARRGEC